ncbi:MAG TPA: DUF6127 family protein [Reyranella sp.]|nr:DUF6127 family protein [Reyranella sp.]
MVDDPLVSMPRAALEELLEASARKGAAQALAAVGLHDETAGEDIRGLRELFSSYRTIKKGMLQQFGKSLALLLLGALILFFAGRFVPQLKGIP